MVPIEDQYFLAGHVNQSHGIDGTVLVIPVEEAANPALFDDVTLVHLQNERGDLIPARINSVNVQQKEDRISFFVKFEHINNRNEAEAIGKTPVFIDRSVIEGVIAEAHAWSTFKVVNRHEEVVGEVTDVIENPAHPILEVSTQQGQYLVPCVDEYVVAVDEDHQTIKCCNLERLIDL